MGARIVLNTWGSFGDVHPYMAVALELRARGHRPVIATMEVYRERLEDAGLELASVRPNIPQPKEQSPELIEKIMEPKTGPRFLMDGLVFPAVRDSYHDLLAAVDGADLLVTHPAAPAGPLVGRKTGIPWISTVLAPFSFFSAYDPPVPPFWQWTKVFSKMGPRVMKFLLDVSKSGYHATAVDEFRAELGVPDYGNPMFDGQHSPLRVLAMFSKIFAAPQPDWPPRTEITGFCFYNDHESTLPPELSDFLDSGPPPIVFTLGSSAVWVGREFYRESIEVAKQLGQRAVLLIGDERNHPGGALPDNMIAVDYVAYDLLMPRASVVVHHGGVGTTSHALLAGVPTLIVPFAFDQSDNAEHAQRLGLSRTVYRNKYRAPRVANELKKLLEEPSFAHKAREVSRQLRQENGPARVADLIEQELKPTPNNIEELAYASGD